MGDTAGEIRFRTMQYAHYRGVHGAAIVYDITNRASFDNVMNWLQDVDRHAVEGLPKLLVGTKCDLESERAVPHDVAMELARSSGMQLLEASAKNALNVDQVFTSLCRDVLSRRAPVARTETVTRTGWVAPGPARLLGG